jgi:phosphatidylinositol alpha-mannosyltransferase
VRVLLTTPYDLAVPGGVNQHALGLLDALTLRGVEVMLVGPTSTPFQSGPRRILALGRVRVGELNGARSRITLDFSIRTKIRDAIRSFRPEIVHLQEPFLPLLNTFALGYAGAARRIGTFHTYSETSRGYLWSWPWCQAIFQRLDARIAVSPAAQAFATRYHAAPFEIVRHGVTLPEQDECRPPLPCATPLRVLFVGRADEPRKGYPILEQAMHQLDRELPGAFELRAVGPGTAGGEVTPAELAAAYREADVCVVPSLGGESFGLVALEALASGLPVIASRIAGYADWLAAAKVGGLVEPGQPAALAAVLKRLRDNPAEYLRCVKSTRAVAHEYSWEKSVDRHLEIYARATR